MGTLNIVSKGKNASEPKETPFNVSNQAPVFFTGQHFRFLRKELLPTPLASTSSWSSLIADINRIITVGTAGFSLPMANSTPSDGRKYQMSALLPRQASTVDTALLA